MLSLFRAFGAILFWIQVAEDFRFLSRSWRSRVAVVGHSMEPTFVDGDWLLRDPEAYDDHAPEPEDLVFVQDSRLRTRLLLKRVVRITPDGALIVAGDHPAHADDGEAIGPVQPMDVFGRPWFRYWPLDGFGYVPRKWRPKPL